MMTQKEQWQSRTKWIMENLDRLVQLYDRPSATDEKHLDQIEKWRYHNPKPWHTRFDMTRCRHETFATNLWQEEDRHQDMLGLTNSDYLRNQIAIKFIGS